MKQPGPFLKVAALASSILLVGGLVGYRANAFQWRAGTTPASASSSDNLTFDKSLVDGSSNESPFDGAAVEHSTAGTDDLNLTIMSGSKSAAVFIPHAPATTEPGSTFIYSSKGGVVFPPPAPAKTQSDATLMSGSKSFILVPPPGQAAANGPAPGTSQSASRSR
jgi:hypothetical protein